jgi:hypothetical protein
MNRGVGDGEMHLSLAVNPGYAGAGNDTSSCVKTHDFSFGRVVQKCGNSWSSSRRVGAESMKSKKDRIK